MNEAQNFKKLIDEGRLSKAKKIADSARSQKELYYSVLGECYESKGDFLKAEQFYFKSLSVAPSGPAYYGLAKICLDKNELDKAIELLKSCLDIKGFEKIALYKLAIAFRLKGEHEKALACCLKIQELGDDSAKSNINIAVILSDMGEFKKANEYYEKAIAQDSDNPIVTFNYSLHLLTLGEFKKGFINYETRKWCYKPPMGEEWKGEKDQKILVMPEQGHGDILQFARFIPELKKVSKKVIMMCGKELFNLMKKLEGVDELIEFNPGDSFVEVENTNNENKENVAFEKYTRIMSLPHWLGHDKKDVPTNPYLFADKDKSDYWKEKIKSKNLKVGLCWQGGIRLKDPEALAIDKRRSISLSTFEPIFKIQDIDFFSLQKGDKQAENYPFIKNFMPECNDFLDTAALVNNLDLIISVDTAVAHLSGALGKNVWVLSRKGGCWRWLLEGEETFWYPSMKIIRQTLPNDWEEEINEVCKRLDELPNP